MPASDDASGSTWLIALIGDPAAKTGKSALHCARESCTSATAFRKGAAVPAFQPNRVRRSIVGAGTLVLLGMPCARAENLLSQLTDRDVTAGLRAALERGAGVAVSLLGKA